MPVHGAANERLLRERVRKADARKVRRHAFGHLQDLRARFAELCGVRVDLEGWNIRRVRVQLERLPSHRRVDAGLGERGLEVALPNPAERSDDVADDVDGHLAGRHEYRARDAASRACKNVRKCRNLNVDFRVLKIST